MRLRCGVLTVVVLLAACTSTVPGAPVPGSSSTGSSSTGPSSTGSVSTGSVSTGSPSPAAVVSALSTAMGRIPASALGDGSFEFGDSVRLRELARTSAGWKSQAVTGTGELSTYTALTVRVIGVNLSTTTSALTVAESPRSVTVLAGGQDRSAITHAATKSGWAGNDVLTRDLDLSTMPVEVAGIVLFARKIRPVGADVVLSGSAGDPAGVAAAGATAPSPASRVPGITATVSCLGDVPAASGIGATSTDPSTWTAAGVGAGTATTTSSVICLGAADPAAAATLADDVRAELESGRSKNSGRPWSDLLMSAKVDVLTGSPTMVRIRADTATPALVSQLLNARDLPVR